MRRILADVWKLDLKMVEREFTLVGVNPALDQFKDLAHELREEAEEQARQSGRQFGAEVGTSARLRADVSRYSLPSDEEAA
jgi:FMN-dependent NADH-azoreductase